MSTMPPFGVVIERRTLLPYVDQLPPSSNAKSSVGGRSNHAAQARVKGEWEGLFLAAFLAVKLPKRIVKVHAKPELEFKRKGRSPDPDNFYFPVSKPLGDALYKGGYLPDDDPSHYLCDRPKLTMGVDGLPQLAKGRTILEITFTVPETCSCGYQWRVATEPCPKCGETPH